MTAESMKARTKAFAVAVLRFSERIPRTRTGDVLGRQLIRSAASVGANYRAACRARSGPEFVAKLGVVEEEADEVLYRLELLVEAGACDETDVQELKQEDSELLAIVVASIKTSRASK